MPEQTPDKAQPFAPGEPDTKFYHATARVALPILVRQAQAGRPITYSDLATELGKSNPRTLNYPLGCVGKTIQKLAEKRGIDIPTIEAIVVQKNGGLPGEGLAGLLGEWSDYAEQSKSDQQALVERKHAEVFSYPYWPQVLRDLGLKPAPPALGPVLLGKLRPVEGRAGGEGPEHKAFKKFVAEHPECIGLPKRLAPGSNEEHLPSGDKLDVSFRRGNQWIAVEVKSRISGQVDIFRGLFQCVKYRAVMEAFQVSQGRPRNVRVILALEQDLPHELTDLRINLGIDVCENVTPHA